MKIIRSSTVPISLNILLKGQLKFLAQYFEIVGVSSNGISLAEVAQREQVRTIGIEMQRQISPLQDLCSLWRLYWLFRKEKPQVVHSITPKAGLLSMIAAYLAGVPIRMHTFTGLIFPSKKGILQKVLIIMDKILCRFATHIYPEGEGVKKDLIQFKITQKPLKIIANGNVNGIDIDYFNPMHYTLSKKIDLRVSLGISESDFVFIFVGRLVGDKGVNELVIAFDRISKEYQNLKLVLVGPEEADLDPLSSVSEQILAESTAIKAVGFQEEVRSYFGIADALVFPSYREGFPNVVMQAGAMGLPSIVSNINGCNEIIVDGQNGMIIPVKNADAIYRAMQKIISNVAFRKQLQQNARPMIVSRYEQHVVWEALLNEYKSLENNV